MKFLFLFSLVISANLIKISHPMVMVMLILAQTLIMCVVLWNIIQVSWFSYILFLVFMGGLMVLFIYICSLASNEKFYLKISVKETLVMLIFIMMAFIFFKKINLSLNFNTNMFLYKIMSLSMSMPVLITMFYLFFTLLVAVNISNKKMGPLRSFKK